MRLTPEQQQAIRGAVARHFGGEATVRLFGSRVNDDLRGGDIDLLIEVRGSATQAVAVAKKLKVIADIQRQVGERKIDVVLADESSDSPIVRLARREGVPI